MNALDEQIGNILKRAKARGHDVQKVANHGHRALRPRSARDAAPAVPSLLLRPLPDKWTRRPNDSNLRRSTRHVAAHLICRALGPRWRKHIERQYQHWTCYLQRDDGLQIHLQTGSYRHPGRLVLSAVGCKGQITVAPNKTPQAAAAEICRRLLPVCEPSRQERQESEAKRRQDVIRKKLDALQLSELTGAGLRRVYSHRNAHELNTVDGPSFRIDASVCCTGTIEFEFRTEDVEFAAYLINAAKRYAANDETSR